MLGLIRRSPMGSSATRCLLERVTVVLAAITLAALLAHASWPRTCAAQHLAPKSGYTTLREGGVSWTYPAAAETELRSLERDPQAVVLPGQGRRPGRPRAAI